MAPSASTAPPAYSYDALAPDQQATVRSFRDTFVKVTRAKDAVFGYVDPTSPAHQAALQNLFDRLVSRPPFVPSTS